MSCFKKCAAVVMALSFVMIVACGGEEKKAEPAKEEVKTEEAAPAEAAAEEVAPAEETPAQ